jgi:Holliday junction DNA helicase RuvA
MIGRLTGRLAAKAPDQVLLDVSGVGYLIHIPLSTFYELPDQESPASLWIHTHVREDALALYGFATPLEHDLFERLIAINGIGPKLALAVLSGIEPSELIRAVRDQDVVRLTRIPGVGKKTAERIGLEMKDRLPLVPETADQGRTGSAMEDERRGDVLSALLNLGYQRAPAEKALDKALAEAPQGTFEQLLKAVLQRVMRG